MLKILKIEDVVDSQKTVYIAGAISDDKNYKQKFRKAEIGRAHV